MPAAESQCCQYCVSETRGLSILISAKADVGVGAFADLLLIGTLDVRGDRPVHILELRGF